MYIVQADVLFVQEISFRPNFRNLPIHGIHCGCVECIFPFVYILGASSALPRDTA